ncbi:MAG: hypothetical protein ABIL09_25090 [Gemmatimonadota bacterium]
MTRLRPLLVAAALPMWLALAAPALAQTTAAYVLEDIDVDGDLSDWPEGMPRRALRTNVQAYGPTDIDGADLAASADLSPSFMVGYDPDEELLYLGVEVRDDELVTGVGPSQTDACEVYLSALNGAGPLQFALAPPGGQFDSGARDNPIWLGHDIATTRTRGQARREGDVTTYEWALDLSRKALGVPAALRAGDTIGFDVVVVDRDRGGNAAWIAFGPAYTGKRQGNERLGRLVLSRLEAGDVSELYGELQDLSSEAREAVRRAVEENPDLAVEAQALGAQVQALVAEAQGLAADRAASRANRVARRIVIDTDDLALPVAPLPPDMPVQLVRAGELASRGLDLASKVIKGLIAVGIILASGIAVFLIRRSGKGKVAEREVDDLTARLETIERRLTDTQEVMIALSERYDELTGQSASLADRGKTGAKET